MSDSGTKLARRLEPSETTYQARIAEYQALRAESDRIAQLLSNSVWVGVTGFGLTVVGAGTFVSAGFSIPHLVQVVASILAVQSMAISTVYASELWKYVRVGTYIRLYIEAPYGEVAVDERPAMYWETWINGQRAKSLHYAALGFLQLPSLCLAPAMVAALLWARSIDGTLVGRWASHLTSDAGLGWVLGLLLLADFTLMWLLRGRLKAAEKGNFGDDAKSLSRSSAAKQA